MRVIYKQFQAAEETNLALYWLGYGMGGLLKVNRVTGWGRYSL